ncbi:MAG: hypothetical protein K5858_01475 [Lachnospiraceae bacterium]|nr:hypothetical protein [Lachnospiraceae bacterium]
MDRSELIKALGGAFKNDEEKEKIKIESAMAGDKQVLRVSEIRQNSAMFELQQTHPDAFVVTELADRLEASGEKLAIESARDLRGKLEAAAEAKDNAKIDEMITLAREVNGKIMGTSAGSQQRAIVYMYAEGKIKNL